jgi:DNA modification methylase
MTERVYWLTKDKSTKLFNAINHHDVFTRAEWQPVKTKGNFKRAYPEQMVEDIISCFPDSNVILDPFSGSGTTCCVAKRMGKKYIGFELSAEYCNIASERISNT